MPPSLEQLRYLALILALSSLALALAGVEQEQEQEQEQKQKQGQEQEGPEEEPIKPSVDFQVSSDSWDPRSSYCSR